MIMEFGINYENGGYVVLVLLRNVDNGDFPRWYRLRNFGLRQGDARCFKEFDCPRLTDNQIKMLIKSYNKNVKWERINSRKFVVQK